MAFECSLAIMTDAAHLLSDVSGFGVAVFAGFYAAKKSQSTHTFGCASLALTPTTL
jgi:zinc transporter 2